MLKAPTRSSWPAGATQGRLPVADDEELDPKVDAPAIVASEEPHRAVRLQVREANGLDS